MRPNHLFNMLTLLVIVASATAHETQTVTSETSSYDVIVGYATEPPYTEERNGLSLTVRQSAGGEPVRGLEHSLSAVLVGPDGEATLDLELRARHGEPGAYTDDFVLTEAGVYALRLTGFIGEVAVDLTFELHQVSPLEELRFP